MKIVLDTNVVIMAFSSKSAYYEIIDAFKKEKYILVVSNEILLEYAEILGKRYSMVLVDIFLDALLEGLNVITIDPRFNWNLIENDPDDNKFVDAAIATGAKFLVTEDKHYNILKTIDFPHLDIINADDFLLELEKL